MKYPSGGDPFTRCGLLVPLFKSVLRVYRVKLSPLDPALNPRRGSIDNSTTVFEEEQEGGRERRRKWRCLILISRGGSALGRHVDAYQAGH